MVPCREGLPKMSGEPFFKLNKYDQHTLVSAFIIRLKLKPMLCWYMFNNQLSRRKKKTALASSICKFHGEIPLMSDFKLPPHRELIEHRMRKRCAYLAHTSWCMPARAGSVTPLVELKML